MLGIQQNDGESGRWYNKWIGFVVEALSCLDKNNYTWIHLPCAGGYYDQDDFLMTVWEYIKISYHDAVSDPKIIYELDREKNNRTQKLQDEYNKLKRKR